MFKVIIELFVMYLLYKLIFDFILPIYQTTKQVKQKVGEMQNKMNEQMKQQQNQYTATKPAETADKPKQDDYIDFEEVK